MIDIERLKRLKEDIEGTRARKQIVKVNKRSWVAEETEELYLALKDFIPSLEIRRYAPPGPETGLAVGLVATSRPPGHKHTVGSRISLDPMGTQDYQVSGVADSGGPVVYTRQQAAAEEFYRCYLTFSTGRPEPEPPPLLVTPDGKVYCPDCLEKGKLFVETFQQFNRIPLRLFGDGSLQGLEYNYAEGDQGEDEKGTVIYCERCNCDWEPVTDMKVFPAIWVVDIADEAG